MADVLDGAAGRGNAEELGGVGAAEPQPDGDLVLSAEDVLDVRPQVGEGVITRFRGVLDARAADGAMTDG